MRILITGGSGILGLTLIHELKRHHDVMAMVHRRHISDADCPVHHYEFTDQASLDELVKSLNPDLIINTIGLTSVDECEERVQDSVFTNSTIAEMLAKAVAGEKIRFVHISTDHIFKDKDSADGFESYGEDAKPEPQNIYGKTKREGEVLVQTADPDSLILRTNFFGPSPSYHASISDQIITALSSSEDIEMFDDVMFTPVLASALAAMMMDLVSIKAKGIFNIASDTPLSKYDFAMKIAEVYDLPKKHIKKVSTSGVIENVKRPKNLALCNAKVKAALGLDKIDLDDQLHALHQDTSLENYIKIATTPIPYGRHYVDEDDVKAVANILRYGNLTQGEMIPLFEDNIARYVGAKYAVAVSSATAGLHLSYMALGIGAGDAVLTSPLTFVSTANAAHFCGGTAVFADINPKTLNLDQDKTAQALKENSAIKLVAPVLFGGSAQGIKEVSDIARQHKKHIVEDAAHALGATYPSGEKVGSCAYSDCTVFSLHPVKSIAAGEGGIVTTNDEEIYKSLLRLRSHGINKLDDAYINTDIAHTDGEVNPWYYEMAGLGYHYRNTDIQIGLANSQLGKLDDFLKARRKIARQYQKDLKDFANITPAQDAQDVNIDDSGNHLFPVAIDFDALKTSRKDFMNSLRADNIITQVHYIPVHLHPFYSNQGWAADAFPNSMAYYHKALSLPLYYGLTQDDYSFVMSRLKNLLGINE